MIAIVDYGIGNIFSLRSGLAALGQEAVLTADPEVLAQADGIILPGVGAFGDAREKLRATGLDEVLIKLADEGRGKPLLGICLGMQMLFEESFEYGRFEGLGLVPGSVVPMRGVVPDDFLVPQIGWNALVYPEQGPGRLLAETPEGTYVYFVHSYYATKCDAHTVAVTDYGAPLTATVERGNVFGCQFHPEKSGKAGLAILKRFCDIAAEEAQKAAGETSKTAGNGAEAGAPGADCKTGE